MRTAVTNLDVYLRTLQVEEERMLVLKKWTQAHTRAAGTHAIAAPLNELAVVGWLRPSWLLMGWNTTFGGDDLLINILLLMPVSGQDSAFGG